MPIVNTVIRGKSPKNYISYDVVNGKIVYNSELPKLDGVTSIGDPYIFQYAYRNNSKITGHIDLSNIKYFYEYDSCYGMFQGCSNITSVDMSGAISISGYFPCSYMFANCTKLTSADLRSLKYVDHQDGAGYMFSGCSSLTSVNLSSLEKIQYMKNMFENCTGLVSISFPLAKYIDRCTNMFSGCTNLETVDFSSVLSCYMGESTSNLFSGCVKLKNINMPLLKKFGASYDMYKANRWFYNCSSLTHNPCPNVSYLNASSLFENSGITDGTFPKLVYMSGAVSNMYKNCTAMKKLDYPALRRIYVNNTSVFTNGFIGGCNNVDFTRIDFPCLTTLTSYNNIFGANAFATASGHSIEVHFRRDMQTTISALNNFSTGWGASAILFDLIGTITVNGNTYIREGYCNKPGYIAWHKLGSTITLDDGKTYNYDNPSVGYYPSNTDVDGVSPGVMFYWKCPDDNTSVRTSELELSVGDMVYVDDTSVYTPSLEITAVDNEFVYTVDSEEPDVGDNVYSDTGTTLIGTIDSIA